jgi:AmmeMemoRadiSam system protein B
VAGFFYPNEPAELRAEVARLIHGVVAEAPAPRALIVPHAGYQYSGHLVGRALGKLSPKSGQIVFLLGPPHRVAVQGIALPRARVFRTPLGEVPVDDEICAELLQGAWAGESAQAHEGEHALEVELPFLQVLLGQFRIVPLLVGGASPEVVARIFERYWEIPGSVFVVSSDLSHFLDYAAARRQDERTMERIVSLRAPDLSADDACGSRAVNGLIEFAAHRGLSPRALGLESSGDHGGSLGRVVGYGAVGFWETNKHAG